jgi:thioesterase domain-containing protein
MADPASLAQAFVRDWGRLSGSRLEAGAREQAEDEILSSLLDQNRGEDAVPAGLELPELKRLFSTFSANYRAMYGYAGGPYPGTVTLFKATGRADEDMEAAALGWRSLAAGGVEVHPVSGDHYSLIRKPQVRALAERLKACIERASPGVDAGRFDCDSEKTR